MTGLRRLRRELQAIRETAMQTAVGCVTAEAAADLPDGSLDAFLDEKIGRDRAGIDVVVLRRFSGLDEPVRIIGWLNESLVSILRAIDGKTRGLPGELPATAPGALA